MSNTKLPDIYSNGNYNTQRIKEYQRIAKDYNIEEETIRDIFNKGADFYKELIKTNKL